MFWGSQAANQEQQAVMQEEKLGYWVVLVEDVPLEPVGGD